MIEIGGSMIPIQEVAKAIFRIGPLDTHKDTAWTSPFLIVGEQKAAILEPGEDGQAAALMAGIKEIGVDLNSIAYIIATHIHLHHIRGANQLLPKMPNATVVVHQRGVPHLMEPTRLNASTAVVWGEGTGCAVPMTPVPKNRIMGVAGGELLDLGGRQLEIIETVGHAPHHICVFDRLSRVLFPGDAMGAFHGKRLGERYRPDIVAPLFEVEKAIDSLTRMRALKPSATMSFGYNGVSFSPDKTLQWAIEDIRAVERICREAMKQKKSSREIGKQVQEYYLAMGCLTPEQATDTAAARRGEGQEGTAGPIGMYRYLMREDPSLTMPKSNPK